MGFIGFHGNRRQQLEWNRTEQNRIDTNTPNTEDQEKILVRRASIEQGIDKGYIEGLYLLELVRLTPIYIFIQTYSSIKTSE